MSLVLCTECRKPVSTDAAVCPHCGKPAPQPPRPRPGALDSAARAALGTRISVKGVLIAIAAIVILAVISSIQEFNRNAKMESQRNAAVTAAKQRDSARLRNLLATHNLTSAQLFELDHLLQRQSVPGHDSIHARAVDLRLDSSARLLSGRLHMTDSAAALLNQVGNPLTAAQAARFKSLNATVGSQRAQFRAAAARITEQATVGLRRTFAGELERRYLDQGMDVTVRATGHNATTLVLSWVLVSRVTAYQFSQQADLFETLRAQGFRRFEITDGYDHTWYWKLD